MNLNLFSNDSDESNFKFGGEMVSGSGVRAVAACVVLREPGADYDLEDPDAPYELRGAIIDLIDGEEAYSGLIGYQDIPRYDDYLLLHAAYGNDWPTLALTAYMERHGGMSRKKAKVAASTMWAKAVERYKERRAIMAREAKEAEEATREAA
ncbi:TPA: hypothetical protein UN081_003100 [Stenotrophomonas maltophilia]|nr:hypothetical protein [Stenotrophomonas pavanii]HEL3242961.1 hypothetical protein [Stenotrophomonas maltophilia]HEL3253150.1 hypothetical protein [Stenotrophomonas maltophilia]HEL4280971.1 hypothetical protein [Stenotrophomonas maltophilia]HEL4851056.1 hypothetical protein [Stenotrophomonas maltophilia]